MSLEEVDLFFCSSCGFKMRGYRDDLEYLRLDITHCICGALHSWISMDRYDEWVRNNRAEEVLQCGDIT